MRERAVSRKKVMPGEIASEEVADHSLTKRFQIGVYNVVYDATLQSIQKRFASDTELHFSVILVSLKLHKMVFQARALTELCSHWARKASKKLL